MIKHWAQEILGYPFSGIYRDHNIMIYVDYLNCFYELEIYTRIKVASILIKEDKYVRPEVYYNTTFHTIYAD